MDFDVIVIGAGVIGLAVASELSKNYYNTVVLEKNSKFGQETSSRNSEVVHSGIYYPQNSLKAKLCIEGRRLLYNFCDKYSINYKKCGKYIVANDEQELDKLPSILQNAQKNGVENAKMVDIELLEKFEPNIKVLSALFFEETGIIDSYSLMKTLESIIFQNSANIAYNSKVIGIEKIKEGYKTKIKDIDGEMFVTSKFIVNCSGLFSDKIAQMAGLNITHFTQYYWKGEYFSVVNGKNKFVKHLVYPVPNDNAGLGIHATIDLGGALRLGPNSFLIDRKNADYKVDEEHRKEFFISAKRYLPFLEETDLQAYQSGIRPKLTSNAKEFRDFAIEECSDYGFANFVQLCGIESPGLTSCLAIGRFVMKLLEKKAL